MRSRSLLAILGAPAAVLALVAACSDAEVVPLDDAGEGDADARETTAPDAGAGTSDAGDGAPSDAAPIDAAPPSIKCSTQPCAIDVATAGTSMCALLSDQTVRCWGSNDHGQLGRGPLDAGESTAPAPVLGLEGVSRLSGGPDAYCATLQSGAVKCWGKNDVGQLGAIGDGGMPYASTPHTVEALPPVRGAFMGDGLACAALQGGDAMCWGKSEAGRIPGGVDASLGPNPSLPPTRIDLGGRLIRAIAPGAHAVVALADDGTLVSWGKRSRPLFWEVTTLGRETSLDPAGPAALLSPTHATALAGWSTTASAASAGGALRWGMLTSPTGPVLPAPVTFASAAHVVALSEGQGGQFCAILSDETARCLGDNTYGQLGTGDFTPALVVPAAVKQLPAAPARIVTSFTSACAVLQTGAVACWGYNGRGQLGTGDTTIHATPALVRFSP